MSLSIVSLPEASSSENLQALAEVSEFATTSLGAFKILQDPFLAAELARLSNAKSTSFVDSVTFQPSLSYESRSQDRIVVEEWALTGGSWLFNAVFDGHLNHNAVEHTVRVLPPMIRQSLQSALDSSVDATLSPEDVSAILRNAIIGLDESICQRLTNLFPRSLDSITDVEIQNILRSETSGSNSNDIGSLNMGGTTVLLSLTDPLKKNLWTANLGDCRAVLGSQDSAGNWSTAQINSVHNTFNATEVERIKSEHPGEPECIQNHRIIGFLEPTRAIGDMWLKMPAVYTRRIFSSLSQEWISAERLHEYADRIMTPPYVSNIPDVYHTALSSSPTLLVLCSDGLLDLYDENEDGMVDEWIEQLANVLKSRGNGERPNLALALLRDGLGGDDVRTVSSNITVETDERWMDDTSIIVQYLPQN